MPEIYYDTIKVASQATMLFVYLHILQKKKHPKYKSWRSGFHSGATLTLAYMIVGAIVIGIQLIESK